MYALRITFVTFDIHVRFLMSCCTQHITSIWNKSVMGLIANPFSRPISINYSCMPCGYSLCSVKYGTRIK